MEFKKKKETSNMKEEVKSNKNRGLIAGYEPNKLSLYIILISSDRIDELNDLLWKDMEKYKIKES